jgi:decaprenyl-phosphate phosphoribosyltransferase
MPLSDQVLEHREGPKPAKPAFAVVPYLKLARPDHWFKNVFMLLGAAVAALYVPETIGLHTLAPLGLAFVATCLVASSNYVLNEVLDGPSDRLHPTKHARPVPSGQINLAIALIEWVALAAAGLLLARRVNAPLAWTALTLWGMGLAYNVPPLRLKDLPYVDVLCESLNNPIRLALGWFALIPSLFPPVSLAFAYWMVGAFFMATKRYAEFRQIGDPSRAAGYRASFKHYTEERLLVSLLFYATACALFAGIFIVRYHLELILFVPVIAGLFAYYLTLAFKPDSPVQAPERLYRERGFVAYLVISLILFVVLLHVHIPALYEIFHVQPHGIDPLWTIERGK